MSKRLHLYKSGAVLGPENDGEPEEVSHLQEILLGGALVDGAVLFTRVDLAQQEHGRRVLTQNLSSITSRLLTETNVPVMAFGSYQ